MSTANRYVVGAVVRTSAAFALDGSAADPTTVAVTIRRPDTVRETYTYGTDTQVVRTAQGAYRLDYTPVVAGQHFYYWFSTGTGKTAAEGRFVVDPANALE